MWQKIKAFCLHSVTMAVSYCLAAIGIFFQLIDGISYIYNGPDFTNWVSAAVGGDTVLLGRIMLGISVLVAVARLRSIMGWGVKKEDEQ